MKARKLLAILQGFTRILASLQTEPWIKINPALLQQFYAKHFCIV